MGLSSLVLHVQGGGEEEERAGEHQVGRGSRESQVRPKEVKPDTPATDTSRIWRAGLRGGKR